jgi:hypothetical protein
MALLDGDRFEGRFRDGVQARESFQIQTGQTRAMLAAHIQRTRQTLSTGMIEAAARFMRPALLPRSESG